MNGRRRLLVPAAVAAITLAGLPLPGFAQAPTPPAAAQPGPPAADDGTLDVAVTYSGKGTVSPKNEISIFLFTDPNITEGSMPVAVGTVEENGGTFKFSGLPPVVYVVVVYDDTGSYEREGPPAPGTPIALYGAAAGGVPEGVTAGKGAKVAVTFDDSNRM